MKVSITLILTLLVFSCTTFELSDKAIKVVQIQPEQAKSCRLVAESHVNNHKGFGPKECMTNTHIRIKNIVAELGGDAYTVSFEESRICIAGGTGISYKAYQCKE